MKKRFLRVLPLIIASGLSLVGCDNNKGKEQNHKGEEHSHVECLPKHIDTKIAEINRVKLLPHETKGYTKASIANANRMLEKAKEDAKAKAKSCKTIDEVKAVKVDKTSIINSLVPVALEMGTVNVLKYDFENKEVKFYALVDKQSKVQEIYSIDHENEDKRVIFGEKFPEVIKTYYEDDVLPEHIMRELKRVFDRNLRNAQNSKINTLDTNHQNLDFTGKTSASIKDVRLEVTKHTTNINATESLNETNSINIPSKEDLQALLKDIGLSADSQNTVVIGENEDGTEKKIIVETDEDNNIVKIIDENGENVTTIDPATELVLNDDRLPSNIVDTIVEAVQKQNDDIETKKLNDAITDKVNEIKNVEFVVDETVYTPESIDLAKAKFEEEKNNKIREAKEKTNVDEVENVTLPSIEPSLLETKADLETAKTTKTEEINNVSIENEGLYTEESLNKAKAQLEQDKEAQRNKVTAATSKAKVGEVELPEVNTALLETKTELNEAKSNKDSQIDAVTIQNEDLYTEESLAAAKAKLEEDKTAKHNEITAATSKDKVAEVQLPVVDSSLLETKADLETAKSTKTDEINNVSIENEDLYTEESLNAAKAQLEQDKEAQRNKVTAATSKAKVAEVELPKVKEELLETKEAAEKRLLEEAVNAKVQQIEGLTFNVDNKELYTEESLEEAKNDFEAKKADLVNKVKEITNKDELASILMPEIDETKLVTILDKTKSDKINEITDAVLELDSEKYTPESIELAKQKFEEDKNNVISKIKEMTDFDSIDDVNIPTVDEDLLETKADLETAKTAKTDEINNVTIENEDLYTEESLNKTKAQLEEDKETQRNKVAAATSKAKVAEIELPKVNTVLLETKTELNEAKSNKDSQIDAVAIQNEDLYTEESLAAAKAKLEEDKTAKHNEVTSATSKDKVAEVQLPVVDSSLLETKTELETAKTAKTDEINNVSIENEELYTEESLNKAKAQLEQDKETQRNKVAAATSKAKVAEVQLPVVDSSLLETKADLETAKTLKTEEINNVTIENEDLYTEESLNKVKAQLEQDKETQRNKVTAATSKAKVAEIELPKVNTALLETKTELNEAKSNKDSQIDAVAIQNEDLYTEESLAAAKAKLEEDKTAKHNEVTSATSKDKVAEVQLPVVDSSLLETKTELETAKTAKIDEINNVTIENKNLYTEESLNKVKAQLEEDKETQRNKVTAATNKAKVGEVELPKVNQALLETKIELNDAKSNKDSQIDAVAIQNEDLYTEESLAAAKAKLEEDKTTKHAEVTSATSKDKVAEVQLPVVDSSLLETKAELETAKTAKTDEINNVSIENEELYTEESLNNAKAQLEQDKETQRNKVAAATSKSKVAEIELPKVNEDLLETKADLQAAIVAKIQQIEKIVVVADKSVYTEESIKVMEKELGQAKFKKIKDVYGCKSISEVDSIELPVQNENLLETIEELERLRAEKIAQVNAVVVENKELYVDDDVQTAEENLIRLKRFAISDLNEAKTIADIEKVELPVIDYHMMTTKAEVEAEELAYLKEVDERVYANFESYSLNGDEIFYTPESLERENKNYKILFGEYIEEVRKVTTLKDYYKIKKPEFNTDKLEKKVDLERAKNQKTQEISDVVINEENIYAEYSLEKAKAKLEEEKQSQKVKVAEAKFIADVTNVELPSEYKSLLVKKAEVEAARQAKIELLEGAQCVIENEDDYEEGFDAVKNKFEQDRQAKIEEVKLAKTIEQINDVQLPEPDYLLLKTYEDLVEDKKDELREKVKGLKIENPEQYTPDSLELVQEYLNDEIESFLEELENCEDLDEIDELEFPKVDPDNELETKAELLFAKNQAIELNNNYVLENRDLYTPESLNAFDAEFEKRKRQTNSEIFKCKFINDVYRVPKTKIPTELLVTYREHYKDEIAEKERLIRAVSIENPDQYTFYSRNIAEKKLNNDKDARIAELYKCKSIQEINDVELPVVDTSLLDTQAELEAAWHEKFELLGNDYRLPNPELYTEESVAIAREKWANNKYNNLGKVQLRRSVAEVKEFDVLYESELVKVEDAARTEIKYARILKNRQIDAVNPTFDEDLYTPHSINAVLSDLQSKKEALKTKVNQLGTIDEVNAVELPTADESLLVTKEALNNARDAKKTEILAVQPVIENEELYTPSSIELAKSKFEEKKQQLIDSVDNAATIEEVNAIVPSIEFDTTILVLKSDEAFYTAKNEALDKITKTEFSIEPEDSLYHVFIESDYTPESISEAKSKFEQDKANLIEQIKNAHDLDELNAINKELKVDRDNLAVKNEVTQFVESKKSKIMYLYVKLLPQDYENFESDGSEGAEAINYRIHNWAVDLNHDWFYVREYCNDEIKKFQDEIKNLEYGNDISLDEVKQRLSDILLEHSEYIQINEKPPEPPAPPLWF